MRYSLARFKHMYKALTGYLSELTFSKTRTLQILNELSIVSVCSLKQHYANVN